MYCNRHVKLKGSVGNERKKRAGDLSLRCSVSAQLREITQALEPVFLYPSFMHKVAVRREGAHRELKTEQGRKKRGEAEISRTDLRVQGK